MHTLFTGLAGGSGFEGGQFDADVRRASSQAEEARMQTALLRMDVERLLMITEALWTLLKEQHGYSDDKLIRRVQKIDLRDGRLDGKVTEPPTKCPKCERGISRIHTVCLYCGTPVEHGPFKR